MRNMRNHFCYSSRNEEAELAKIPGDGDLNMEGIDLFVKILVFVKILEQCKKDKNLSRSLDEQVASSLDLKTVLDQ